MKLVGIKILIIDDRLDDLFLLTRALHRAGYKNIHHAENGTDGVNQVKELKPDLILLDLNMPRLSGRDVIIELAKGEVFAPILLLSETNEKVDKLSPMVKNDFCERVKETIEKVFNARLEVAYVAHTIQDVRLYAPHLNSPTLEERSK